VSAGESSATAGGTRMLKGAATAAGLGAAVLWASLGLLTTASGGIPPFQLLFMTFAVGSSVGIVRQVARGGSLRWLRQPWPVWALGIGGLFGYHALYFTALKLAPPAEANLLNYLWPLLIVLLSGLLPGESLRARHVGAALLGLAGMALLAYGRGAGREVSATHAAGFVCAIIAALVWAGYSVLSRRFRDVPTDTVTVFCVLTAGLGFLVHLAAESWVPPAGPAAWAAIALNGLGPVGAAFYLWDVGMKRGDIRLLGIVSYGIPVVSTLLLVLGGFAEPSAALWGACLLIVAGAVVGTTGGRRA
jgi:drug/metabolite transporter (DMT)-like permease